MNAGPVVELAPVKGGPKHGAILGKITDYEDLPPSGIDLSESWRPVAGATGASVSSAVVHVMPSLAGARRSLGVVVGARSLVTQLDVVSPEPRAPIVAIALPGLRRHDDGDDEDGHAVDGEGGLGGRRLAVAPIVGGTVQAPVVSARHVDAHHAVPALLTGARLSGQVLEVPGLLGDKWRITMVTGSDPTDFDKKLFSHGDVTLYAGSMPVGLHVMGPEGDEQQAVDGPLLAAVEADITAAVNRHLTAAAAAGDPIAPSASVSSDVIGKAAVWWTVTGGVIERALDGDLVAESEGAPLTIDVPGPHPGRAPRHTVAHVTVTHHGIALHPLSDPVPSADAGLGGPHVRDAGATRALPPEALRGHVLRRVGVIGWPRGATDLTLEVLGATATVEGLDGADGREAPEVVWFDVGAIEVDGPVVLRLTATRGAFSWVADPEPRVRLGIAASPDHESVRVGGLRIDLTGETTEVPDAHLGGTAGFAVATDQFCTVTLSRAVMRFAP